MKRLLGCSALAILALGLVPAHAGETSGTIMVPTATVSRAQRCRDVHGLENGIVGWTLTVRPGRTFTLVAADGVSDFDISFHAGLAACASPATAPANDYVSDIGDEAGTVPAGSTHAIINLVAGVPGAGFTYTQS